MPMQMWYELVGFTNNLTSVSDRRYFDHVLCRNLFYPCLTCVRPNWNTNYLARWCSSRCICWLILRWICVMHCPKQSPFHWYFWCTYMYVHTITFRFAIWLLHVKLKENICHFVVPVGKTKWAASRKLWNLSKAYVVEIQQKFDQTYWPVTLLYLLNEAQ